MRSATVEHIPDSHLGFWLHVRYIDTSYWCQSTISRNSIAFGFQIVRFASTGGPRWFCRGFTVVSRGGSKEGTANTSTKAKYHICDEENSRVCPIEIIMHLNLAARGPRVFRLSSAVDWLSRETYGTYVKLKLFRFPIHSTIEAIGAWVLY